MVWFPTWRPEPISATSTGNDPEADLSRFLTVCDEEGELLPQALEVLGRRRPPPHGGRDGPRWCGGGYGLWCGPPRSGAAPSC